MTRTGATLHFRPDFVAKNEGPSFQHSSIYLPRIGMRPSIREDSFCCPVRALAYYLDRTANIRTNDQLFLTHASPHGPASKRTLARWIVQIILDSGAVEENSSTPTAHSTRSVASSWAYHKGLTISDICNTVSWKAPTTFTAIYYRNIAESRGAFARAVLERALPGSHTN